MTRGPRNFEFLPKPRSWYRPPPVRQIHQLRAIGPLLLALVLGCPGDNGEPEDATVGTDDGATPDIPVDDGVTPPDDGDPPEPFLTPGFNYQGKSSMDAFVPIEDGTTVDVVLGPQGAWMMVAAGHTNAYPAGTEHVAVEARLTDSNGDSLIGTKFKKRPVFLQPDGSFLLMNVYLVVSKDESWDGQKATFELVLSEFSGEEVHIETSAEITLQKTTSGPGTLEFEAGDDG